ncbi:MAG: protein kinase [Synergistaceae bacterium]|jgi:hypothetical protein|nr:protein kinase [Synergistaceae bacterium]
MASVTPDETLREAFCDAERTVQEDGTRTIREGEIEKSPAGGYFARIDGRRTFRGDYTILEQLPTKGAEADIYLLEREGERHILKLYRHRMEPKLEVLEKIGGVSRANSHCFVVFRDAGFDGQTGRWYELQEYFPLGSLKDIPEERKRRPAFVRELVSELAEAIHCLHENGIVHCDIKPGNVLVRSLDPPDLVLTDFGIASLMASDVSRKMTTLKGTPMYWAPEAFSRMVGRPCDWWGLGVIVLELLAGAHPLEGLMDSQIIHRLTVGNLEIPDFIAEDWRALLRGLLTKDDVKRWGHEEVLRWLSGERGIPVYYEAPAHSRLTAKQGPQPFRFEGRDLYTLEELARALCGREQPWELAAQYLRYIRQWMESNMLFDEAVELGNATDKLESGMALFRFVHTWAKGPFAYQGKVIDVNNLRLFLARVARREAGFAEERIVRMLGDGSLRALYGDYVELSGNSDPVLEALFPVMEKKAPEEQWVCFEAFAAPGDFVWPRDADTGDTQETIAALDRLGVPPLRRDTLAGLEARYVLPDSLLRMLDSSGTYALGLRQLDALNDEELLIPDNLAGPLRSSVETLELEDYIARARVVCLGHTPAAMARLSSALGVLEELTASLTGLENDADVLLETRTRMQKLYDKKIGPRDVLFLTKLLDLLRERAALRQKRSVMYPISAVSGASLLWLAYTMLGGRSSLFLRTAFIIAVVGALIAVLFSISPEFLGQGGLPDGGSAKRPNGGENPLVMLVVFIFAGLLLFFNLFLSSFPTMLPLLTGTAFGSALYYLYFRYSMKRVFGRIVETCFIWLSTSREGL